MVFEETQTLLSQINLNRMIKTGKYSHFNINNVFICAVVESGLVNNRLLDTFDGQS